VTPDIMATAKGMGAGYTPIAAVVAREEIVAALRDANVSFIAGHTYSSNPLSCAVSLAVLRYTEQHDLVENARVQGERLFRGLERLRRLPIVGDVRGLGLLAGVELVADQATKAPLPVAARAGNVVGEEALKRGLIVFPCTGAVDGQRGDMILLAPPLVITADQIDDLVDILEAALEAAAARLLG
jgi:adenosylmethionine-8-amino-7-oxononanoate aminotransferase